MSNFLPVVKLEFINDKQVPAVTSQQLAEAFGKQHAHVMRDIRETTAKCSKLSSASNAEFNRMEETLRQTASQQLFDITGMTVAIFNAAGIVGNQQALALDKIV